MTWVCDEEREKTEAVREIIFFISHEYNLLVNCTVSKYDKRKRSA